MISLKARLPYEKTANLQNAFDYIKQETFEIQCRQSILEVPVGLAKAELRGIRDAKAGVAKMKATMRLDRDLIGDFEVHDRYIKSAASVVFNAGRVFREFKNHSVITRNE